VAQEVVREKDFPCPCGKGVLRIEILEHDTWSSGRHSRWSLRCDECAPKYREPFLLSCLVLREHAEEIERRRHAIYEKRKVVGNKASDRYLSQFKERVKSLQFKTAMHDALGAHESIQSFRKRTRLEKGLHDAIDGSLKNDPTRALKQINVEDAEITAELKDINKDEANLNVFINGIPKHPIPKIED